MRGADGVRQFVGGDVLEQVADGAGFESPLHEIVFFEAGKGDHLYVGMTLADGADGGGAVDVRHDQVHEDHVGLNAFAFDDGLVAVAGFTDKFQVIIGEQEGGEAAAYHGMVIHQHHANPLFVWQATHLTAEQELASKPMGVARTGRKRGSPTGDERSNYKHMRSERKESRDVDLSRAEDGGSRS